MFDSPFLSDGSKPLRGTVLTYTSLVIIALSLIYFVCALGWEIKTSRRKKKTKRQIMWSKLKGFKHKIVEDSRNKAKQDKLNKLFNKSMIQIIYFLIYQQIVALTWMDIQILAVAILGHPHLVMHPLLHCRLQIPATVALV